MRSTQQNAASIIKEYSAKKRLAFAVLMVAIVMVIAVFWVLRINGITLGENMSDGKSVQTDTDASVSLGQMATVTDSTDGEDQIMSGTGQSVISYVNENSGISVASDETNAADTPIITNIASTSGYSFATTANYASGLTSEENYIIYTIIDDTCYVVLADGSLVACTTVAATSDITSNGFYYLSQSNTIACVSGYTLGTEYASSLWTVTEADVSTGAYSVHNTSSQKYLSPDNVLAITTGFSAHTGELTFTDDFTLTYTFTNTSNGTANWENFIVEMVSSDSVYVDVRADNYGWLANANEEPETGAEAGVTYDTITFGAGLESWDDWYAAMAAGTEVTVTIVKSGADVTITTTAAGVTFTAIAYVSDYSTASSVTVYLTGENCTIANVSYSYTQGSGSAAATGTGTPSSSVFTSDTKTATMTGNGSDGGTIVSYSNYNLVVDSSNNSATTALTWETGSGNQIFYFAQVQTTDNTGESYHFVDTVTLADAAANQDDSYLVYTQIGDTYFIVSAVDGSLLACTDISSYSEADKVLLSAGTGVYIWDYDATTKEPEFKFTTSSDEDFADYRWTVNSDSYDSENGTGTYTLENEANGVYLGSELNTTKVSLTGGNNTGVNMSDVVSIDGYGTVQLSIQIDGYNGYSQTGYYTYLQISLSDSNGVYSDTKLRWNAYSTTNTGTADQGWDWLLEPSSLSSYSFGGLTVSLQDVVTVTIITTSEGIFFNYYNENTSETYVCFVNGVDLSGGYSLSLYRQNGSYTITSATASYDTSIYNTANYITGNSTSVENGVYSYTVGTWSEVGVDAAQNIHPTRQQLTGDFDITYSFTNTSTGSVTIIDGNTTTTAYYYNYAIELFDGSSKYIDLRADDSGWTSGCDGASFTYETAYADFGSWSDWQALMESGAVCTVRVIRTGDNFFFITTASGTVNNSSVSYTFASYVTVAGFGDSIYVYLMGEQCTLSGISYINHTARNYNETTYNRLSSSSQSITVTAVDSGGNSTSEASYLWSATSTGSYKESFTLIAQLAADAGNTAEIDWVEDATAGATASGTAVTTLSNASVSSLAATGNLTTTFSLARVKECYVWFDGTNGGMSSYSSGSGTAYDKIMMISYDGAGNLQSIITPSASDVTDASGYGTTTNGGYTLRGWYDIYNGDYYEPGSEIMLKSSTVMYADWQVTSYDIGENTDVAASVSTDSFITTRLFDYNELFNLQSLEMTDSVERTTVVDEITYKMTEYRTLTLAGHRELFNLTSTASIALDNSSLGFLFFRTETYPFYYAELGYTKSGNNPLIDYPDDRGSVTSANGGTVNGSSNATTQGILGGYGTSEASEVAISSSLSVSTDTLLTTLFGTRNTVADVDDPNTDTFVLGKTYVGTADYLFQYNSKNGYYYYNSELNAATYNVTEKRFYVYDYTVKADVSGSTDDFLPYNYAENNGVSGTATAVSSGSINYWFGMSTEIEFYLSSAVPSEGSDDYGKVNLAIDNTNHMTFKFSGDDDVWVFIDGVLVLDLGGVHGQVYGEIDFSTGQVMVVNAMTATVNGETITCVGYNDRDVIDYTDAAETAGLVIEQKEAETYVRKLGAGSHTLTFYYLERGASQSNAAIYFNIGSITYNLNLSKVDKDTGSALDGAEFTFYTDSTFTTEAELQTGQNGSTTASTFSSSETVYGLLEGRTYYVVESKAPDGYSAEGKYFTVSLSSDVLTITVYDSSGNPLELYTYKITYANDGTCTWEDAGTTSVTNTSTWDYVQGDKINFTATLASSGTVAYYTVGFPIANAAGYEIPATGSIGTGRYMAAGRILILVAAAGLIIIAFYQLVWSRRFYTEGNKGEITEDKARSGKHGAKARERPHECRGNRGHARDRPR